MDAVINSKSMMSETEYQELERTRKMMMWLGIVGMIMVFAALTSAYIVSQGGKGWEDVPLPSGFYISTVMIVLSSAAIFWSSRQLKANNTSGTALGLLIAFGLGAGFVASQLYSWGQLVNNGFHFVGGSVASSYLYAISGVHLAHMAAGIIALLVTTVNAANNKYTAERKLGFELAATFWHFLGVVWVYLLFFLLFIR